MSFARASPIFLDEGGERGRSEEAGGLVHISSFLFFLFFLLIVIFDIYFLFLSFIKKKKHKYIYGCLVRGSV